MTLTQEEAKELARLEVAFDEAGARGVGLAEQIDALRVKRDRTPRRQSLWLDDSIQFPRLLAEIVATQDNLDIAALCESMDLDPEEVDELFDRAQSAWESHVERLCQEE